MASPPDLICLGEPMVEFNRPPQGDGFTWVQGFGGDTSNAAIAAARQGARVGYATALGQDWMGDALLALWAREGIDTTRVSRHATAPTGVYFVTHGEQGHKFDFLRKGSAASLMDASNLPNGWLAGTRVLHVSAISQAISGAAERCCAAAIDNARAAGVKVSYDTNLRLRLWDIGRARSVIDATVAQCDLLFPSLDDSRLLTGLRDPDEIVDRYLAMGVPLVLLKMGADGALVATASSRHRLAPLAVRPVDATGAGDCFAGSFLARWLAGDSPLTAARYANVAAALSTRGFGAVAPIPSRAEVEIGLRRS